MSTESMNASPGAWPALPLSEWQPARDTPRPMTRIVGKVTGEWDRAALERPPGWVNPVSEETAASW
jgi:hypothetical protein